MPKLPTIFQGEFPYHIRARCINRQWFDIPKEEVWEITSNYLYFLHHAFDFKIHAYVLMDNHYHGIVSTPNSNLDEGMNYFQREVSRRISERAGRINQTWGGPYKPTMITTYNHFLNTYKYVYRNPVEAGLSTSCEGYKFSTLNGLLGQGKLIIPVVEDTILFDPLLREDALLWLNQGKKQDFHEIRQALKKSTFQFRKCRNSRLPVRGDDFIF